MATITVTIDNKNKDVEVKSAKITSITSPKEADSTYNLTATAEDNTEYAVDNVSAENVKKIFFALLSKEQQGSFLKANPALFKAEEEEETIDQAQTTTPATPAKPFPYSMHVLSGFIAAIGVTAVAVGFLALNAASFGIAGLAVAAIGAAATLAGVGLFAVASVRSYRGREAAPVLDSAKKEEAETPAIAI